ncbi:MAG TPA: MotA/TolQ/ExbB proton channel family protein [Gammaproteobacteria bacterium]|jgi:biopolymer transport protein ExbB|nr:MotA/TolQ/ExbB proton channel family protein [Xanthomonadales bacterium]MCB1596010.1 MotA/TolQ/ExbB proton channel family protein [Xanthomonadales bacterium]HOP23325.1 MotA/TolQ/ExbB proton channel family protein [Gammaproteobacteria bacterium]HPQ88418.1 MotA/TolQ/ExbB proton channel family protein [Gammaproteobacteria bacterium]
MLEIVTSGGVVMIFILILMALAMMIVGERFWSLRNKEIIPADLKNQVIDWSKSKHLDENHITKLEETSPLGYVMASALRNRHLNRESIVEVVEDAGRHVVHKMEKPLNWLSVIAEVSPLLGLLGTVIGMIKVFAAINANGVGDAAHLASGISQALITTAAGLVVAIPAMLFHRHFKTKIGDQTIIIETQVMELIDSISSAKKK